MAGLAKLVVFDCAALTYVSARDHYAAIAIVERGGVHCLSAMLVQLVAAQRYHVQQVG